MAFLASSARVRWPRTGAAGLAAAAALAVSGACHAQVDEYALKAAFVYNIAAFAEWRGDAGGAMTMCVQAGPELAAAVAAMAGRSVAGRRVQIARTPPPGGCDVLVQAGPAPAVVANAKLVICDACQLPDGTSTVSLVREGNRIRFDVDASRARAEGVVLSSQLLKLARRVL